MSTIMETAERVKKFIAEHKDDPEVRILCADLRDVYAAFAAGDHERISHIASVDPDVLKAVDLAGKLDDMKQRREKASAFMNFCADLLQVFLASKGIKL